MKDLTIPAAVLFVIMIALQFCTVAVFFTETATPVFYGLFAAVFAVTAAMIILKNKIFKQKSGAGVFVGSIFLALFYKASEFFTFFVVMDFWDSSFEILSIIGILIFLLVYVIIKTITKKDGVVLFTTADAIAVFIGTTPFAFCYTALLIIILNLRYM